MRTRSALPLLAALALALPLAAQHDYRVIEAVVLVQFGPGDLVLNAPLLDALFDDPAVEAEVRKVGGTELSDFGGVTIELPAPHVAGTFQLHVKITGRVTAKETRDKVVDVVVTHLSKRLDALLYDQPRQQLEKRRAELSNHHAEVLREQSALRARAAAAADAVADVHREREALAGQGLAVRLELATEQRANEHLEKARSEHARVREDLREQRAALGEEEDRLVIELRAVDLQGPGSAVTPEQLAKWSEQVAALQGRLASHRRNLQRLDESLADANDLLARTLEQLPASTLALQRARARLDSLEREGKELAARAEKAAAMRGEAAHLAAQTEQLQIDIGVCRTLLTDVQGKLGRLEPVRYELLRQG